MRNGLKLLGDGTIAQGVVLLDDDGDLVNIGPDFQQDLIGNAGGYYPDKARGFVFGRKVGVNNTIADLWEGPTANYVFPTSGMQMLTSRRWGQSWAGLSP